MADEYSHQRVNDILLGPLERPALRWLAARMPRWVTPDMLTGVGAAAAVLIFVAYWLSNRDPNFLWLASFGFVLNWFGDSLDGNLARYRKEERPRYGYFVDHTVDAVTEVIIFLGMGVSPYISFDVACLALVAYMLLAVMVYITTYVNAVFRISYAKLGPTEMRVIVILANALVYFIGNPKVTLPLSIGTVAVYDLIIMTVTTALFSAFLVMLVVTARDLNKLEPSKQALKKTYVARSRKARRRAARAAKASKASVTKPATAAEE